MWAIKSARNTLIIIGASYHRWRLTRRHQYVLNSTTITCNFFLILNNPRPSMKLIRHGDETKQRIQTFIYRSMFICICCFHLHTELYHNLILLAVNLKCVFNINSDALIAYYNARPALNFKTIHLARVIFEFRRPMT